MTIELVRTINGVVVERVDLRFVQDVRIDADVSPEVYAEFKEMDRQRRLWHEYINSALGVPADVVLRMLSEYVPR